MQWTTNVCTVFVDHNLVRSIPLKIGHLSNPATLAGSQQCTCTNVHVDGFNCVHITSMYTCICSAHMVIGQLHVIESGHCTCTLTTQCCVYVHTYMYADNVL